VAAKGKRAAAKQRPSSGGKGAARSASTAPNPGQFRPGNPYVWKPGQSGNPAGARKGPRLSDLLHDALQAPMPADQAQALQDLIKAGATIGEIIAWAAGVRAAGGDLEALGVIADRTEGAPEQTLHLPGVTADDLAAARARAQAWEAQRFAEPAGAGAPGVAAGESSNAPAP